MVSDNAISSRLVRCTDHQEVTQSIVGCFLKTPDFTAPTSKPVKRYSEIAVMIKAIFYDSSTIVEKEYEEATPPSPLIRRSPAFSSTRKYEEKKNSEK